MKLKYPGCSTGHGTGVTPPVDLARLLQSHTSLYIGRVHAPTGSVDRPAPRAKRPAKRTKPARVGYFTKRRLARQAELALQRVAA